MTLAQKILRKIETMPETAQAEVLDFVDFLKTKRGASSEDDWSVVSLSSAMRGMEDESRPQYSKADLKEKFQ